MSSKYRKNFEESFKQEVVAEAARSGSLLETSLAYRISDSTIRRWRREQAMNEKMKELKKADVAFLSAENERLKKELATAQRLLAEANEGLKKNLTYDEISKLLKKLQKPNT